ncbi:MAG TPA: PDZ domain-containing protein [Nitrososphaera sp.]|nr:PDZ domain-containing protein [Nitrososphaera sp.]
MAHSLTSTVVAFAILFAVVGASFAYVGANQAAIQNPQQAAEPKPWTGITGIALTPELANATGTSEQSGFLVTEVAPNSPAEKAGMRGGDRSAIVGGRPIPVGGDIIVESDGKPVTGFVELEQDFQQKHVGDTMKFTIVRGSVTMHVSVVLEERPPSS